MRPERTIQFYTTMDGGSLGELDVNVDYTWQDPEPDVGVAGGPVVHSVIWMVDKDDEFDITWLLNKGQLDDIADEIQDFTREEARLA